MTHIYPAYQAILLLVIFRIEYLANPPRSIASGFDG